MSSLPIPQHYFISEVFNLLFRLFDRQGIVLAALPMSELRFIDSHMHCGISPLGAKKENLPISMICESLKEAEIDTCCFFANVVDIYDRSKIDFVDSEMYQKRRKRANHFLRNLSKTSKEKYGITVYPYFFVWNDYDVSWDDGDFLGIKWHRHSNEPRYNYDSPKCEEFLQKKVYPNRLPIVYEEELENTVMFANRIKGRTILIIPHLGLMNGGYRRIKEAGVFGLEWVYADMSLAPSKNIKDFVKEFGSEKLLFGSDWPFGNVKSSKEKLLGCELEEEDLHNICYKNIERILKI